MNKFELTLIRHGSTDGNLKKKYIGRTNESLSHDGSAVIDERRALGCYPDADFFFISPMKRCRETAELIYPGVEPVVIDDFREIDFGKFEGLTYDELCTKPAYTRWLDARGESAPPDGESRGEFVDRCCRGFQKMCGLVADGTGDGENIRVSAIVHGGTIMAVLSSFADGDYYDYQVGCGEGYTFTVTCEALHNSSEADGTYDSEVEVINIDNAHKNSRRPGRFEITNIRRI